MFPRFSSIMGSTCILPLSLITMLSRINFVLVKTINRCLAILISRDSKQKKKNTIPWSGLLICTSRAEHIMLKFTCQDVYITAYIGLLYLRRQKGTMASVRPSSQAYKAASLIYDCSLFFLPPSLVYRSYQTASCRSHRQ